MAKDRRSGTTAIVPQKTRWTGFIIVSLVIVVVAAIVGVFYYQVYVAPFHRTVLTVDGTPIRMDYFLKITRLTGAEPMAMLSLLGDEQLIKQEASRYVGEVSPGDIDQELRRMARGSSGNISEGEFKAWYRQQINETGLTDSEFREYARTSVLATRLQEYLAERVPTIAEQVHLQAILLENYEDEPKVRKRLAAGESFADIAGEMSADKSSAEEGGDLGWLPRGIMGSSLDQVVFALSPGAVSELVGAPQGYFIFMVSEKADAREIDRNYRQILQDNALQSWLAGETQFHEIKYNYNSEIDAWIKWQLSKMASKQS